MALFLGVLFALPVSAATTSTITLPLQTQKNVQSSTANDGNHSHNQPLGNNFQNVTITGFDVVIQSAAAGNYPKIVSCTNNWTGSGACQNSIVYQPTQTLSANTGTDIVHFDFLTPFPATSTYVYLRYSAGAALRSMYGTSNNSIPIGDCFIWDSPSETATSCGSMLDAYVVLYGYYNNTITPEAVIGQRAEGRTQYGNIPIPTSTYVGTVSSSGSLLPNFSWGSATGTATSSGTYATHLDKYFSVATSTFPMCFVYPWFALIDLLEGQTLVNQTAQSIKIGGGMMATTTFTLESFPSTATKIGFKSIIDQILAVFIPLMWLAFGLFVFVDLFQPHSGEQTE